MSKLNRKRLRNIWLIFVVVSVSELLAAQPIITIEKYRQQVRAQDPAYEGAVLQARGAQDVVLAADAISDMQIFIKAEELNDKRPTLNPIFQGDQTTATVFRAGIKKQSEWGPQFTISQNYSQTQIYNAQRTAVPMPDYHEAYPEIQLSIPFWRNFLGAETRAKVEGSKALNESRKIESEMQLIQSDSEIDMAFYTTAANFENVKIQKDILDRAQKILSWVRDQYKRGLIDVVDLYQAQAAVDSRKIELLFAENQLRNHARKFNDLRGVDGDVVAESLAVSDLNLNALLFDKNKVRARKDLKIQSEKMLFQRMDFQASLEEAHPQLDLTAKAQWVGRELTAGDAYSTSQKGEYPLYYVGIEFSMPIDVPKYLKVRRGLRQMRRGEELKMESQKRDFEISWHEFVDLGLKLQDQVQLFRSLEATQKLKSEAEQKRFQRGRSTTFQVLTFEQDYNQARSQRLSAELQARQYMTQVPLFEE